MMNEKTRLLEGRVALVTGASRGIGAATAKLLARHGASVGVNYHSNQNAAEAVVREIEEMGGKALAIQANVGDYNQVKAMALQIQAAFGPIDTLVLNAVAVNKSYMAPFLQAQQQDFEEMVLGELRGVFIPSQVIVPSMIEQKRGCIIAVSSGLSRRPSIGSSAISVGKSAVDALVKTMAMELGPHGIRVNAVAPGLVETEASVASMAERQNMIVQLTPLKRVGQPEDIAGAILLLAANEAQFITGAYLPVSGGMLML